MIEGGFGNFKEGRLEGARWRSGPGVRDRSGRGGEMIESPSSCFSSSSSGRGRGGNGGLVVGESANCLDGPRLCFDLTCFSGLSFSEFSFSADG